MDSNQQSTSQSDNQTTNNDLLKSLAYGGDSIHEATGAEKHRLYVAQYLGADDVFGIENQLFEIFDNSVDEVVEYQTRLKNLLLQSNPEFDVTLLPPRKIYLEVTSTDEIIVMDEGRGLPCGLHSKANVPAIYLIYESDSAGGKGNHDQGGYTSATAGQHGAGAAVSKSCTEFFNITTSTMGSSQMPNSDDYGTFTLSYVRGNRTTDLQKVNGVLPEESNQYLAQLGIKKTGTEIKYKFDSSLFTVTKSGIPCEHAYDKDRITERIKYILLGVEDKNALEVYFKYKEDEVLLITPKTFTPESFLGVTNEEDFIKFETKSRKRKPDENDYFSATVYINQSTSTFGFSSKTVCNRLSLNSSATNSIIKDCLRSMYYQALSNASVLLPDKEKQNLDRSILQLVASELTEKHKTLIIMTITGAKFDGQTKSNLKNTAYEAEFRSAINGGLKSVYVSYFSKYINAGIETIRTKIKLKIQEQKMIEQEKKKKEQSSQSKEILEEAKMIASSERERLKQQLSNSGDSSERFLFKPSTFPEQDSYLVLVEGSSAAAALGDISELPIAVAGLGGKPANIYNKKVNINYQQLRKLIIQLQMNYRGIFILTDADSDALHIRALLIAIITEYAKHYITNGMTYIIGSPNAKIFNQGANPVTINIYGKKIIYPGNTLVFTKSPMETEMALKQPNMILQEKYSGLSDSLTDGDGDIVLSDLIQDPDYRQLVLPPSKEEYTMLLKMLSDGDEIKVEFTNGVCTDRLRYVKRAPFLMENLKLPRLDFYNQMYSQKPLIKNLNDYTLKW